MSFYKTLWMAVLVGCAANLTAANVPALATDLPSPGAGNVATAVLSGGCFWGVEAVYERLTGVIDVVAGYAGGKAADAQYEKVETGRTGHAESVQITYDPSQISYGKLLQVFFAVVHDPTEIDRQGPDFRPQYRSVIFYSSDAQKKVAQAYIAQIERARVFSDPIATRVSVLPGFFPAEESHQHFIQRNPGNPYAVQNDLPKLRALAKQFPELLMQQP
jgi:peptide-methionine (S)-S-oxide reductase